MGRLGGTGARWYSVATVGLLCTLASAGDRPTLRATADGTTQPCGGAQIAPDRVIEGTFESKLQGSYVMLPFDVPKDTTQVRVKYCWDAADQRPDGQAKHTLDLGIYEPLHEGSKVWGGPEFRGWGGSSHPDVQVTPQGYGPEEAYLKDKKGNVPGRTTRGFRPGPIAAGRWAVELGLGAIVPRAEGDSDDSVRWRVEIELSEDPAFAVEPYEPAPYDARPANTEPGWYAGDFHVHAEHSALGDATMREAFDYAFRPIGEGGAGLDFLTLSDYVAGASWSEIGRHQGRYPGRLVMRSAEVITYQGHWNSHANTRWADYRAGSIYDRRDDGTLERVRGPRSPGDVFQTIHDANGFVQINHPTIFPSAIGLFRNLCRGCPWDHSAATTGYRDVDAIEVITGPAGLRVGADQLGPNPFVVTGIDFWLRALDAGAKAAAVGSSDSHTAGRIGNPITSAPIGDPTTMVYADELSERGVQRAVEAGHTYVKLAGNDGPDLRLTARVPGAPERPEAIMGDTVDAPAVDLEAQVLGGRGRVLLVMRGRTPVATEVVTGDRHVVRLARRGPGRYWLQLLRGTTIEGVSSPIHVGAREPLRVAADAPARIAVRHGAVPVDCLPSGTDVRACAVEVRARVSGKVKALARGSAPATGKTTRVTVVLGPRARARVRRAGRRGLRVTLVVRATDREGRDAVTSRAARLRLAR